MIYIAFKHGHKNFGDLAVSAGVAELLKPFQLELVWLCARRNYTIKTDDVVIYGGGEHLTSQCLRFKRYIAPLQQTTKYIVLPSTFGPFTDHDQQIINQLNFDNLAARDIHSANLLGIPTLLDPAFFLAPLIKSSVPPFDMLIAPRRDDIGMRLGDVFREEAPIETTNAYKFYMDFPHNPDEIFVAHTPADIILCEALANKRKTRFVRPTTLANLFEYYVSCNRVFTNRFHSIVFAALHSKEYDGFAWPSHGHKLDGLLHMLRTAPINTLKKDTQEWVHNRLLAHEVL
jgi:hypothetical protein